MKCHKINNVDKNVCTAEQKIAYNFAFAWSDVGKKILNSDMTEVNKSEAIGDIERFILESLQDKKFNRFNKDAIIVAFRQGFKDYCQNYFIATSYKEIGNVFCIPYGIE